MLLSLRLQKLPVDSLVVHHWMVFLKTRPSVKWNSSEFTNVFSFTSLLMCSTHFTLSCRILPFFLITTNNFFKFVYSEITGESAWWVLFRPTLVLFASLTTKGHQNWTHFNSGLLISRTFLPHAGSSCILLFCLYLVSCTQKMHWWMHNLADTVPLLVTILQFASELSNNWGTGLPYLRPSWIYCTGQQHKASLFLFVFLSFCPAFTIVASWIVLIIRTSVLSFHTCTITSPFLRNADSPFFKHLPSPSRSCGMPLLALIAPQTLTFLSSNVWANLTLL